MSAVVWFIHFLRSIHQEVVWEVISAIFCFQGLRLILRWLRESRGHGPRGEAGTAGARAIETLQQELGAARRSGYFRDRVMHRLRDLAIDVASLHIPTTQTSEKISAQCVSIPRGKELIATVNFHRIIE